MDEIGQGDPHRFRSPRAEGGSRPLDVILCLWGDILALKQQRCV